MKVKAERDKVLFVRVTAQELALVARTARRRGLPVAAFVRSTVLMAARDVDHG